MLARQVKRGVRGCLAGAVILMASQSAHAVLLFQESFEGPLKPETNIIGGFIDLTPPNDQNYWAILPSAGVEGPPFWDAIASGGVDGSKYFAGRDLGPADPPLRAVDFENIDISGFTNIQLTVALASRRGRVDPGTDNSNTNFEPDDILSVRADLDGGGFAILDQYTGDTPDGGQNIGLKAVSNGFELISTLQDLQFSIADGTSLTIRIDARFFTTNNEAVAFDNIRITGDRIPEPATLALFGFGLAGLGFARRRRMI